MTPAQQRKLDDYFTRRSCRKWIKKKEEERLDEITKLMLAFQQQRDALEEIAEGADKWTAEGMAHIALDALGNKI